MLIFFFSYLSHLFLIEESAFILSLSIRFSCKNKNLNYINSLYLRVKIYILYTIMNQNLYTSGKYLNERPKWHSEDSKWKAENILKILKKQ